MQETHTGPAVPWREKHILLVTPRQCTFDRDRGGLPSFIVILRRWSPDLSPPQWVPRLDNRLMGVQGHCPLQALWWELSEAEQT